MSVTQVYQALGSFEFELTGNVPRELLDTIEYFGHIAIIPGRLDPKMYEDNILDVARYVGVVRKKKIADDGRTNLIQDDIRISGVGMEFWLGDEDGKGDVIENELLFDTDTFSTAITALVPDALTVGTIHAVSGSYTGRHQYETPRVAIKYVCDTMSTSDIPVGYRVNNDGSVDAGPESDLFVTDPVCIIVKKGVTQGEDMFMRSLESTMDQDYDMEDFTTRVVMLAEESEEQLSTGSADIDTVSPGTNTFKDLQGNPLRMTRLVSESDTIETNAATRAELALRNYLEPHRSVTIAADDYEFYGSFQVGDYVWAYDPDGGIFDLSNEVYVRGVRINPIKLRVTEADWPVTDGYTVAYRDADGTWYDLTDYIHWEEEQPSNITVGDFTRNLTEGGESVTARVGSFIQPDASIPDAPTWVTGSFTTDNYLDGNGLAKAAITVVWNTPINQDSSAITDGDHYELNYRIQGQTDWSVLNVAWGTNSLRVADLSVATSYEFRIRGVDRSNNLGTWSTTETVLASSDTLAPSTPAAPIVAASSLAIQVKHELGQSGGGTFNLEADLAELEVHMSSSTDFTPSADTYVGSLRANKGMIDGNIPAVGTFPVDMTMAVYFKVIAVDTSGNKSAASDEVTATAELIDDAHISDLTVTKVSAGTISSDWLIGANIQTGVSGQRVVINQSGIHAYNAAGDELVTIDAATGLFTLKTADSGTRMEITGDGLKTYDQDGDLSSYLASDPSAASGDYLSFRGSDGGTVASISALGVGTFEEVWAGTGLYVEGSEIRDLIDERPRGLLSWVEIDGDSIATTGTSDTIMGRVNVNDFDTSRAHRFTGLMHFDCNGVSPTYMGVRVRYAWDTDPTTSSSILFEHQWGGRDPTQTDEFSPINFLFDNTMLTGSGTNLHMSLSTFSSVAGIRVQDETWNYLAVEDAGPTITRENYAVPATGGGGGGGSPPATYTKSYSATWTGSYQSDGDRRNSNGDMYQGYYSSTNGNQKSVIGFNNSQIQSDLSGATINSIKLTMKNKHFYYNSGGSVVVGYHNSTASSAPASYPGGTESVNTFTGWAKGATKTVTLSNSIGNALRDDTAEGIIIGPGDSTNKIYYGYFQGGASSSSRPKLTITYTK
jgi:hypothetical protein